MYGLLVAWLRDEGPDVVCTPPERTIYHLQSARLTPELRAGPQVHERIEPPTAPFRSARRDVVFGGWLVLVVFGALLWTIVLYAGLRFTRCRSNRNLGRLK